MGMFGWVCMDGYGRGSELDRGMFAKKNSFGRNYKLDFKKREKASKLKAILIPL
jgi:hypothetical protein